MSIDYQNLGQKITRIRKTWGYTQKQVYQYTKVSIETQRRIEHGLKEPKLSTLERLSSLYKVDLVKLAIESRREVGLFSDQLIRNINRIVWQRDLAAAEIQIQSFLETLKDYRLTLETEDPIEKDFLEKAIELIQVVKDIGIFDMRNKKSNVIRLENMLMSLDSSKKSILRDPYQLNLEVTLGLFLVTAYHMLDETALSLPLLDRMDHSLYSRQIKDMRNNDYMIAIRLNKAIAYQMNRNFQKVYDITEELLRGELLFFSPVMLGDLLCMRSIAMSQLGIEGAEAIACGLLHLEQGGRRKALLEEFERYGIKTPPN